MHVNWQWQMFQMERPHLFERERQWEVLRKFDNLDRGQVWLNGRDFVCIWTNLLEPVRQKCAAFVLLEE